MSNTECQIQRIQKRELSYPENLRVERLALDFVKDNVNTVLTRGL